MGKNTDPAVQSAKQLAKEQAKQDKITKQQNNLQTYGNKMGMPKQVMSGLQAGSSILGAASSTNLTQEQAGVREGVRSAIGQFGPIGCVCAGTRVVTNLGEFKNIEDLCTTDGIVG